MVKFSTMLPSGKYLNLLLCLIIGVLIALLFQPSPAPVLIGKLTTEQEEALRAEIATLEATNDSLKIELQRSKELGKVQQREFSIEIDAKSKTIANLKANPVVIELVKESPALDSLHKAYESKIASYKGRTMALTLEMQTRDRIANQLIDNFQKRLSDTEQLLADSEAENQELQKHNKKLKRKLVLTKISGVAILAWVVVLSL